MARRKPWDRPTKSLIPNRPGDRSETPLFTALGRAVSAWEGVQAATSSLFCSLLDENDEDLENAAQRFGQIQRVHERAKMLEANAEERITRDLGVNHPEASKINADIEAVLASYRGLAERRNDLAHGYVTEFRAPDYEDEDQKIVTFFLLMPSQARTNKWFNAQPEFNYVASEIDDFARRFQQLDEQIEAIALRLEQLKGI